MDTSLILSLLANLLFFITAIRYRNRAIEFEARHDAVDTVLRKYVDKLKETFGEKARIILQEVLQAEVDEIERRK